MDTATLIRERRLALKLTQAALANRAGLSERTIRNAEAGRRRPTLDTLTRIAGVLKFTAAERSAILTRSK